MFLNLSTFSRELWPRCNENCTNFREKEAYFSAHFAKARAKSIYEEGIFSATRLLSNVFRSNTMASVETRTISSRRPNVRGRVQVSSGYLLLCSSAVEKSLVGACLSYTNPTHASLLLCCAPFAFGKSRPIVSPIAAESAEVSVFVNPCLGDVGRDENAAPLGCSPVNLEPCPSGFFCLPGDPAVKNSSFCCPRINR